MISIEAPDGTSMEKLPSTSVTVPFVVEPFSMTVAPITGPMASFTMPFTVMTSCPAAMLPWLTAAYPCGMKTASPNDISAQHNASFRFPVFIQMKING